MLAGIDPRKLLFAQYLDVIHALWAEGLDEAARERLNAALTTAPPEAAPEPLRPPDAPDWWPTSLEASQGNLAVAAELGVTVGLN